MERGLCLVLRECALMCCACGVVWQVQMLMGEAAWSVSFSTDGSSIVIGSEDNLVKIWNVATDFNVRSFKEVRFALPETPKFGVERYCFFCVRFQALSPWVDPDAPR